MTQMISKNHQLVVIRVHKVARSSYDDKRVLLDDSVKLPAYGHCKISKKTEKQGYC